MSGVCYNIYAFVSKDSRQRYSVSPAEEGIAKFYNDFVSLLSLCDERDFLFSIRFVKLYKEVKSEMPSEKVLLAKQARVAELTDLIKNSASGVLVNYEGISVEEDTKLRKEMREAGVNYFVEKNTLLRFAFKNAGLDDITNVLEGTTAIAISNDDQTAPARILGKFAEGTENKKFALKAGYIGEEVYDEAGVNALSKIPSREVLLAMLVGSLQGPMQKLAATLQAVVDKNNDAA